MAPISSVASCEGTATAVSPSARRRIASVMPATGRMMLRLITRAMAPPRTSTSPIRTIWTLRALATAASMERAFSSTATLINSRAALLRSSTADVSGLIPVSNTVFRVSRAFAVAWKSVR